MRGRGAGGWERPGILRVSVCDFVVMHWFYSSLCLVEWSPDFEIHITMCDDDPPTPEEDSETQPDEEEEEEESLCTRGGSCH